MPAYFVDSSALVKVYVSETGSSWVRELLDSERLSDVYLAAITPVEVVAALTRRSRSTGMGSVEARTGMWRFRWALDEGAFTLVHLTRTVLGNAMHLAETYCLRGYDAVQLAAALSVRHVPPSGGGPLVLVSADAELNSAAVQEGLAVEDLHDANG